MSDKSAIRLRFQPDGAVAQLPQRNPRLRRLADVSVKTGLDLLPLECGGLWQHGQHPG